VVTSGNIERLAREISGRICRQCNDRHPESPMTEAEIATWVAPIGNARAADLEAGVLDDNGNRIPGVAWERGLAAYRERIRAKSR
jgi:hypothetical protein